MKVMHKDGVNNTSVKIFLYLYDLLNIAPTKLWFLEDNYTTYDVIKSSPFFSVLVYHKESQWTVSGFWFLQEYLKQYLVQSFDFDTCHQVGRFSLKTVMDYGKARCLFFSLSNFWFTKPV